MAWATLFSTSLPTFVAFGGVVVLTIPWLIKLPRLAMGFLFLSLVAGQLIRLSLPGQGGGLLLSDLAIVVVLLSALLQFLLTRSREIPLIVQQLTITIMPFVLWSIFTLLVQSPGLGFNNTLIAASYWVRLTALLLLLPALTFLFHGSSLRRYAWRGFYLTIALLTLLGITQLIFLPNLAPYAAFGWDPHQFRLVSTWIDPNFFGAFLAMGLAVIILGPRLKVRHRAIFVVLVVGALFATQSRSAFIALVLSLLFTMPFWLVLGAKKLTTGRLVFLASAFSMLALLILLAATVLLPRFVGLIAIDSTVQARITKIQMAVPIIVDNSLLGVGYNAYQFAAQDADGVSDFQNHSRAGTDNSLLTIWATTGLIGLFLFLLPWIYIVHRLIVDLRRFKCRISFLGLISISILFVHAQFVNSLLYSHLLITLIIVVALALSIVNGREQK